MGYLDSSLSMIEGERDIFLYNSRNGKKIKCSKVVKDILAGAEQGTVTEEEMATDYPGLYDTLKKLDLVNSQCNEQEALEYNIDFIKGGGLIKSLRLNISEMCNLDCSYCYERVTNHTIHRKNMDFSVARKAMDFFREVLINNKSPQCMVRFFGGEPLINYPLMKDCIEYIENTFPEHIVKSYVVNTNGTLITAEMCRFFKEYHVIVILSIDGLKEQHDVNRRYKNGAGSFEKVNQSIDLLAENGCVTALTTVMTDQNFSHLKELIDYVAEKKSSYDFECKLSLNNVHICNKSGIVEKSLDERLDYFFEAIEYAKKRNVDLSGGNTFMIFNNMMHGNNGHHCGGNGFELCVSPEGNVYGCGAAQSAFGTIDEGMQLFSKPEYVFLATRNADMINKCKGCPIASYCGGGCVAESFLAENAEDESGAEACELEKRVFSFLVKEFIL